MLALAATPPALAALGLGVVGVRWWHQPAGPGFTWISPSEAAIVRSLAGAAWPATAACPLDGADADLDHFVDGVLSTLAASPRSAIRMGLHTINDLCLPTHQSAFSTLDRTSQQDVLAGWLDSESMHLRTAALSLVLFIGMGYTIHPATAGTFGHLYRCRYGQ
ncbi:MAG: gluconate 2-dehydrogenase subunit 3 family protein [Oligoflexia bacterium]|nr:gluconate 2-dehydrogenase subunit 3 family protein [Oligoflexia bacterium]